MVFYKGENLILVPFNILPLKPCMYRTLFGKETIPKLFKNVGHLVFPWHHEIGGPFSHLIVIFKGKTNNCKVQLVPIHSTQLINWDIRSIPASAIVVWVLLTIVVDKPKEKSPRITSGPGQFSPRNISLQHAWMKINASAGSDDVKKYATGKLGRAFVTCNRMESGMISSLVLNWEGAAL